MTEALNHYDPLTAVVDALHAAGCHVQPAGRDRYEAQCPAHDDRSPSLSVSRGTKGEAKAVVYCHAGCGIADILAALELSPGQLFADYSPQRSDGATVHHLRAWRPPGSEAPKRPKVRNYRREKVAHYDYATAAGQPCARVVRYLKIDTETGEIDGKTFTQQRWDEAAQTYLNGLDGLDMPVYHADVVAAAIAAGAPIVICEGEKDADAVMAAWKLPATCNPMGAGAWRPHHTEALRGASQVVIIADNDDVGREHARAVAAELREVAETVMVRLPTHGKDVSDHIAAGGTIAELTAIDEQQLEAEAEEAARAAVREAFPAINWQELWDDDSEEEWIIEPILPARRLVALYSAPKVGKSLLMLEIGVCISRGSEILGYTPPRPFRVLYVDFENDPKGDVRTRLQAMGYGPGDLDNLFYLSFPTLAALDSAAGAEQLLAAIDAYAAEVVVIDTVSRAVSGDENENDTWLAFYRNTGLALKQARVALIRLDHSGKDETKGQRGGSAKSGDVDAIWRMSKISDTTFTLTCEAARIQIAEKTLTLHRETSPRLRHRVDAAGAAAAYEVKVDAVIRWLDDNGIPDDAANREVRQALADGGQRYGKPVTEEAVRRRKQRIQEWKP